MGFVIILVFYLLELQDWVAAVSGRILCSNLCQFELQEKAPQAQAHLLKVRELMLPAADEPDEDQTEAFLLAAQRGNSTKVRRVCARLHPPTCHQPERAPELEHRLIPAAVCTDFDFAGALLPETFILAVLRMKVQLPCGNAFKPPEVLSGRTSLNGLIMAC